MTLLALLSLAAWIVLVAGRRTFWRIAPDRLPFAAPSATPSVLAIVPARDEAQVVARTIPSLLEQDYAGSFHVLLVDDNSTDGTGECARRSAGCSAARLTVLDGHPLPPGWTGKLWAMQQGLDWAAAQDHPPRYVLFTDADIRYEAGVLSRLVAQAQVRRSCLTSLMVRLRTQSLAERLLVPAFVFFFRMLYPFRAVGDPACARAAAAGGSMLVEREALADAGGLAAIRDALIDDCALGALMKRRGPIWLGMTNEVHSIRAYPRFDDIRRMVSRSAYAELRYSPLRLVAALLGLALVFFVPPLGLLAGHGIGRIAGGGAWLAMTLAFWPTVRFYRVGWWTAPLLPFIAFAYALFTADSAIQHRLGRGGAWKGRIQAPVEKPASP